MAMGVTAACGSGTQQSTTFGRPREQPIRMEVTNNNFLSVTVYAVSGSSSYRLGDVGGKGTGRFTINTNRVSIQQGVQFRVDPLGSGGRYLSPPVFPDRGSWVELVVGSELSLSYVSVR